MLIIHVLYERFNRMIPVAVTFVDDKMLALAREQSINFGSYDVPHEIIHLPDIQDYGTDLWIRFIDLTVEKIAQHGKIFRVDAEIRMHRPLPAAWLDADNVLFQPWPLIKEPFYVAINTGHMILSQQGIGFLETLKECMLAMIPPDGDTNLVTKGKEHHIEDEWPSGIAIRLSKLRFLQERLCHDRRLGANCAISRGLWLEENTVLTHPGIHNWDWAGAGLNHDMAQVLHPVFVNHYAPSWDVKKVDLVAKLLHLKNGNVNLWTSLGANFIDDTEIELEGWNLIPSKGLVKPSLAKHYKELIGFHS